MDERFLPEPVQLSPGELRALLRHAARAVAAALRGETLADQEEHGPGVGALQRPAGVFVTLRRQRELAGCIGFPQSDAPLWRATGAAARSAALDDPRFMPQPASAMDELDLEISVLSPLLPITAQDYQPGVHGLVLQHRGRRGLLLPQVAAEHELDREGFLGALCRKAGLPPSDWQDPRCELYGFTAQLARAPLAELLSERSDA